MKGLGTKMEKITKREMYNAIKNAVATGEWEFDGDAVVAFCDNEIALLDKKAAKAKETAAKKKAEGDELMDAVQAALGEDFEPISEIAARIEGEDITVSKVTYRLTQLVKNGVAEKQEIAVPAADGGKTRKVMGYKLA